jgi:sugar O-acyltransferase (sialic acid O-acetyltransferase NeuD family)
MRLALFGAGGHAREVAAQINHPITFFVDDEHSGGDIQPLTSFDPDKYKMMIAVGDCIERKKIAERLPKETKYFTFIHPTALIMDKNIEIGEGSFIGAYSILTTKIKLGKHVILNRSNHVSHDCVLGDYVSLMPNALLSGNVEIGDCCWISTNASIREKIKITNNVTIGMGAAVVKNIDERGTYVGVPAKKIMSD